MDVAAWLRGLGLEQYAQLFHDNDIDGEILCGMTAEDLKELGISSFGHRRRLLNAITALGGEPPTRDVAQSATSRLGAQCRRDWSRQSLLQRTPPAQRRRSRRAAPPCVCAISVCHPTLPEASPRRRLAPINPAVRISRAMRLRSCASPLLPGARHAPAARHRCRVIQHGSSGSASAAPHRRRHEQTPVGAATHESQPPTRRARVPSRQPETPPGARS